MNKMFFPQKKETLLRVSTSQYGTGPLTLESLGMFVKKYRFFSHITDLLESEFCGDEIGWIGGIRAQNTHF